MLLTVLYLASCLTLGMLCGLLIPYAWLGVLASGLGVVGLALGLGWMVDWQIRRRVERPAGWRVEDGRQGEDHHDAAL